MGRKEKRRKREEREAALNDDDTAMQSRLEAERNAAKMKKLQADAGMISPAQAERLDWMYEAQALDGETGEDHLMNEAVKGDRDQDLEDVKKLSTETAGSLFLKDLTRTTNDTFRKLREDPLFQIKKAEHRQRQDQQANPLIMARLRDQALRRQKKEKKKEKKRAKKEKKAAKKAAKQAKRGGASSSSSSSSDDAPRAPRSGLRPSDSRAGYRPGLGSGGPPPDPPPDRGRSRSPSPRATHMGGRGMSPVRGALRATPGLGPRAERKEPLRAAGSLGPNYRRERAARGNATQRMSEEVKRRKLEEMTRDGHAHEVSKDERIRRISEKEKALEEAEEKARVAKSQSFMQKVKKDTYMGDDADLGSRMRTQRNRLQTKSALSDERLVD